MIENHFSDCIDEECPLYIKNYYGKSKNHRQKDTFSTEDKIFSEYIIYGYCKGLKKFVRNPELIISYCGYLHLSSKGNSLIKTLLTDLQSHKEVTQLQKQKIYEILSNSGKNGYKNISEVWEMNSIASRRRNSFPRPQKNANSLIDTTQNLGSLSFKNRRI